MLQLRGGVYASRVIVPAALQPLLGRVEITRSLRTGDAREARRRLGLWETHLGCLFARVLRHGSIMTPTQLDELTRRYLAAKFDEIEDRLALDGWTAGGLEEWSSQLNERCHELSGCLAEGDLAPTIDEARALAPASDEHFQRKLARRMLEIQLKAGVAELSALSGEPLRRPRHTTTAAAPSAPARAAPTLSNVARMYAEDRNTQGRWSPKTARQSRNIFNVIVALLGDRPIGDVTKDDIRHLGLQIPRLPSNMTKRFPGKSPSDVLEMLADDSAVPRLEPRSVNKYLQHVRTLFAWAEEYDFIDKSPATVLRDVEEGRAQDARKVFDDNDIAALFAEIERRAPEPYGLWIPRIMAYTGCRMGEAAQLRKVDIRHEQGVWVFDFNEESDQKNLKTDGSARQVPVHPRLIDLGILEFIDSCADGFLFPERVRYTENELRGNMDRLSKQLNRWLRIAGIADPRKSFQSFRGTLATRLKDLGIPEYQIAEIVGHENDNITSGRYGKRTNLAKLYEALSLLTLPI